MRNWAQFNPDSAEGISPLSDEVALFSTEAGKHRLDGDFISRWLPRVADERTEVTRQLGKSGPFW